MIRKLGVKGNTTILTDGAQKENDHDRGRGGAIRKISLQFFSFFAEALGVLCYAVLVARLGSTLHPIRSDYFGTHNIFLDTPKIYFNSTQMQQRCKEQKRKCNNVASRADGLHPAKTWRTIKSYIFFPALEFRRKLFLRYLLPLLPQIAYFVKII